MKQFDYKVQSSKFQVPSSQPRCLFVIFLSALPFFIPAQQKNLPLNREFSLPAESRATRSDTAFFSSVKPWIESRAPKNGDNGNPGDTVKKRLFYRKLRTEHLLIVRDTTDHFHLILDPLFNFEYGKDYADSSRSYYKNTRGILVQGDIGKKFSFESSFYENQATFAKYIRDFNDTFLVVPGQGRWKRFKKHGYDFAMSSGYISYSPNRHFNFQAGHGKHFIGDGYRSLLLSDNAFNYPFARITSSFGKFQYTNLYSVFMNLTDGGAKTPPGTERLFQKKAASFQFLSWNPNKRIQLGLFQGMIWQASDTQNRIRLNPSYFNPVILVNAFQYGLSNANNILLGSTLKITIARSLLIYGQFMLDDAGSKGSSHNKQGFQLGAKYFNLFGIKNLHAQAEYNQVRPYAYAQEDPSQSYTHYNQALAHPLGANFREAIVILNYRIGNFLAEVKFNYALIGKDSLGQNLGSNIFSADKTDSYMSNSSGNQTGQGIKTTLRILDAHLGYLVNPSTNFNIVAGVSNRSAISSLSSSSTNYVYLGIRTSLNNVYYDF